MAWFFQIFSRHNLNFSTFLGLWLFCLVLGWLCLIGVFLLVRKKNIRALYHEGLIWIALKELTKDVIGVNGRKIKNDNRTIVVLLIIERLTWIAPLLYVLFSGEALATYIQAFVWLCVAWVCYRAFHLIFSDKKRPDSKSSKLLD